MSETDERIQEALAAYLDYLELGGPKPDTSHLSASEQEELEELIGALEMTEGVAFGLGRESSAPPRRQAITAPSETGDLLVATLRDALPADVRIDPEPTGIVTHVGAVGILDTWVVRTFGGRVRVWLVSAEEARELEDDTESLADLGRAFGMFPDTTAIALVAKDMSCLIVQPEDCAPTIHIPGGAMVSRRYTHPIQPVGEAIFLFLNELIPYWDPVPAFDPDTQLTMDVPAVSKELVEAAVETQRSIGGRARKGNPKKNALIALGDKEIAALTKMTKGLFDGNVDPDEIESQLERLAEDQ